MKPAPEPLEGNDVAVIAVGTAVWLVAFVVVLLLDVHGPWRWACLAGAGLGLAGAWYCRRRNAAIARARAAGDAESPQATDQVITDGAPPRA